MGVREDDVLLAVLPLFHIYALNVGLGSAIRVGASLVLVERFDPVATLEVIGSHGITILLGAPPMYLAWLATPGISAADLQTVRVAVSGAAALPGPVLERFRDELGLAIWEGYGLTEAAPAVTSTAMGTEAKPGTVGLALPDIDLRLVDESGVDVEPGDPGEVWVRGPNVFRGYWNDEEATAEVLTDDGWLKTGDVGIRDGDGYLRLVDRKRDLIIVSGFNVYPREVENALHEHPDVAAAAAIGVPHPYTGEAVKVYVVPRSGAELSEEEVATWARGRLARFKCPEIIHIVDELPYTATGKVKRSELRTEEHAS
jgi:long-chain acyl-CoA synthetase